MKFRFAFLVLAVILFAHSAFAAEPIGSVVEIEGAAVRADGSAAKALSVNDTIYLNDVIETKNASRLLISFIDDTEITLGENSSLTVDKYIFDPADTSTAEGDFSVMKGSFLFVSGLLTKNQQPKVNVSTSYGTIGLRGTTVWGGELDGEYGVLVQDGEVDVTNEGGTTRVAKGLGTFMKNRLERPRLPKNWAPEKTARAVKAIALARPDLVRERLQERKAANAAARRANTERKIQTPGGIKKNIEQQLQPIRNEEYRNNAPSNKPGDHFDDFKRKKEALDAKKERMNGVKPPQGQ